MKRLLPLIFFVFLAVFSGCGDKDKNEAISKIDETKKLLIGRWILAEGKEEFYDSKGQLFETGPHVANGVEFEFSQTKLDIYVANQPSLQLTYTIEERQGKVFLILEGPLGSESEVISITKENLTLQAIYPTTAEYHKAVLILNYTRK
ncbi:hypothetical protein [Rufibacter hautae]|uniref:Lipocalin-like domain-containing protein n=1 Tax=Rufibacter hautae TaxID=2595005 RepID=A0A5B6TH06_9BACT|nr:hypothetical protein [Rufibacter hautae]KAA3438470.1 hypothetical protein FOA19_14645 [Rufibacter hautae]